mgnify:CR=1 FL=1
MVYRIFVEKKDGFNNEAKSLYSDITEFLGINKLRIFNRYDAENISEKIFDYAIKTVFSEPQLDNVYKELNINKAFVFATEYLPGQFDQRAESASQCIQIISQGKKPLIKTAKIYALYGNLTKKDIEEIKKYIINPVEMREANFLKPCTLKEKYKIEQDNILEAYKIMVVRYEISRNGYSSIRPVTIAKDVSRESAVKLGEQSIYFPGISATNEPMVSYPSGSLASHILGYVGNITETELDGREDTYGINDVIGKVGIQYVFEEYLRGKDGIKQLDMSVDGTITDEYITQEAVAGSDVILTIDANLQAATEKALANNIKKIASGGFSKRSDAKAGAAVVMNVKTGEILAMASYPDYEPELFVNGISQKKLDEYNKGDNIFNRAISGVYAPGSTFKMITAIAGLETGVITPTEKINDIGVYKKAHEPACWIWNSYGMSHGWLNVTEAITHSCNYFFYEVGYRATIDNIAKYAKYYGLGEKTNVELPMEEKGIVATRDKAKERGDEWQIGETLSAAIGQSYNSYTPIQMAKYISMLANGGKNIEYYQQR